MRNVILFCLLFLQSFACTYEGGSVHSQNEVSESFRPIIVFDFGGVIGGTDRPTVAREIAKPLGISYEEALALVKQMYQAKDEGVCLEEFWKEYAVKTDRKLPHDWACFVEDVKLRAIRTRPGMLELAKSLRNHGYRVAMLSNVTTPRAQFIRESGFYDPFDPVVLSCEINVSKPHREAYKAFLGSAGAVPQQCLFIDNKQSNIDAAQKMGFDTILFESIDELTNEFRKRQIAF
jgi:putative hydrolase of the HAD superfamily